MITEILKYFMMEITHPLNLKTLNGCFEENKPSDIIKVNRLQYTDFLEILTNQFLPIAVQQTECVAKYIAETSGKDFFVLWHFLRRYIYYETDPKGDFETIKMPNHVWANRNRGGGGDCEDINALFCSSILVNWGIEHEMIIEHLSTDFAHIFVQTQEGIIIDSCNSSFNRQVRLLDKKPIAIYRKSVNLNNSKEV